MRLKDSTVRLFGLRPEVVVALLIADGVFRELGVELVLTSGTEYTTKHSSGSIHYSGGAFDIRTRQMLQGMKTKCLEMLRERLGAEFDVVDESDHFHIEFQPKG